MDKGMSYKAGYCSGRRGQAFETLACQDAETYKGWKVGYGTFKLTGVPTKRSLGRCDCGNMGVKLKSNIPVCQRCLDIEERYYAECTAFEARGLEMRAL